MIFHQLQWQQRACYASVRYTHVLAESYRHVMREIAATPAIITTPNHRGLTISSLTSLSISKPNPLVSFNIQVPSAVSKSLHSADSFAINILPANSVSARLCRSFGGSLGKSVNPFEIEHEEIINLSNIMKSDIDLPVIKFATVLVCTKRQVLTIRDHEVWIANVINVYRNGKADKNLIYLNREFHEVGSLL